MIEEERSRNENVEVLPEKVTVVCGKLPFPYMKMMADKLSNDHPQKEIVLLHLFRKKSQKTPALEIDKAKRERADYVKRSEKNDQVE